MVEGRPKSPSARHPLWGSRRGWYVGGCPGMSGWARVWTAHSRAGRCSVSPRRSARGRTSALCCRPHGTAVLLRCRGRGSQLPIARPAFVVWCWWTRSATAASRRRHPPLLVDQDEHPFGLIDDCPVVCNFCDSGSYESCCSALQWCRQRESYATCWIKSLPASGAIRVAGETERCRNHQLSVSESPAITYCAPVRNSAATAGSAPGWAAGNRWCRSRR